MLPDRNKVDEVVDKVKALTHLEWEQARRLIGELPGICRTCLRSTQDTGCVCDEPRGGEA